jgi:hypothetical protein
LDHSDQLPGFEVSIISSIIVFETLIWLSRHLRSFSSFEKSLFGLVGDPCTSEILLLLGVMNMPPGLVDQGFV